MRFLINQTNDIKLITLHNIMNIIKNNIGVI